MRFFILIYLSGVIGGDIESFTLNWAFTVWQLSPKVKELIPLINLGIESISLPDCITVTLSPESDLKTSFIYGPLAAGMLLSHQYWNFTFLSFFEKLKVCCTNKLFEVFKTTLSTLKTTFESTVWLLLLLFELSSLQAIRQNIMADNIISNTPRLRLHQSHPSPEGNLLPGFSIMIIITEQIYNFFFLFNIPLSMVPVAPRGMERDWSEGHLRGGEVYC